MATDSAVRPASTVVLLRDSPSGPQTFLLRRHHAAAFMAGAHVFPGGRVEAGDSGATAEWCDGLDGAARQPGGVDAADAIAHAVAAVRELFEEAGVLLARTADGDIVAVENAVRERYRQHRLDVHAGTRSLREVVEGERLRLALDALTSFAHWVTPGGPPRASAGTRRFDTRFFVARAPDRQSAVHDDAEATDGVWMTAAGAIAAATARRIVLPPPTWVTLRELQPFMSVEAILSSARIRRVERREPTVAEEEGRRVLVLPDSWRPVVAGAVPFETRFVWAGDCWRPEGLS